MSEPAKTTAETNPSTSLEASFKAVGDRLDAIRTKPNRATLALMLHAGGDRRIWPEPATGRNRYGLKTAPAPNEISFGSTTASTISPMSFEAVGYTYSRLFEVGHGAGLTLGKWFAEIRGRITQALAREGDEAIIAASGTDAAIIALSLARGLSKAPITSIYFAPEETGAGVPRAAAGRHFSDMTALGSLVKPGDPIAGLGADLETVVIPIRDERSTPRAATGIDDDVARHVDDALKAGRDVVITLLDTAKTGLGSMSRDAAKSLAAKAPGRVHVIVDACQLRTLRSQIKADLECGFFVTITGSKYIAGPAFSGAVLVPKQQVAALSELSTLAPGLADYSAALDWPKSLRHLLGAELKAEANIGLGFRWTAALEHLDQLIALDEATETSIHHRFISLARDLARYSLTVSLAADDAHRGRDTAAIMSLAVSDTSGKLLSLEQTTKLYRDLKENEDLGPVCHVGQPVNLAIAPVIRIAPSAMDTLEVAERLKEGLSLEAAFEPIRRRLETVFEKWNRLMLSETSSP